MKKYTFFDKYGKRIGQVKARTLSKAITQADNERICASSEEFPFGTNFYSENIKESTIDDMYTKFHCDIENTKNNKEERV